MSLRSTKIYLNTQKELAKHFELFWQKFTIYLLFDHFSQEGELYIYSDPLDLAVKAS